MRDDGQGRPLVIATARGLGVRSLIDIDVDEDGMVEPDTGGMSVSPESYEYLPVHRRPPTLGGTGLDPVWEIDDTEIGDGLAYREDEDEPLPHGVVEPAWRMEFAQYEELLAATRDVWREVR
jgi:hypothetical protein